MASLNKAQIIGNLGRDPEVAYLPSGEAVAKLAVATTEGWKDKSGERKEETTWHRVTFFGRLAEVCSEYLSKGSAVYVEGKIKTRKYTDKDGIERYATEIVGNSMQMLGGRDGAQRESSPREPTQRPAQTRHQAPRQDSGPFEDDSIPF